VYKTEECLWDIYKMTALTHLVQGAYVVIPATLKRWASERNCTWLFTAEPSVFDSADVFLRRGRKCWEWAITATARPLRVHKRIRVVPIASAPMASLPSYAIRAIRVHGVPGEGWLDFDGDWPISQAPLTG
jgi:hypothetical protein